MRRLDADRLQTLVARACERMGASPEDAAHVAASLVRASLCGYDSHGVFRLAQYHEWWKTGVLRPAACPVVSAETGFAVKVDGRYAFGRVVGAFATRIAIRKARQSGIAAGGHRPHRASLDQGGGGAPGIRSGRGASGGIGGPRPRPAYFL
jgi:LDH2 family malate/lactate/ureidoglycolate dehydrogenase